MTGPNTPAGSAPGAARPGARDGAGIDWHAAAESPEFKELVARRRRFVLPATIFFLAWFIGFILLAGYAEDFMGQEFIWDGLTVGYVLALTQFIMTWGLCWLYLRVSDKTFDPLAKQAAERAIEAGRRAAATPHADGGAPSASEEVPR